MSANKAFSVMSWDLRNADESRDLPGHATRSDESLKMTAIEGTARRVP